MLRCVLLSSVHHQSGENDLRPILRHKKKTMGHYLRQKGRHSYINNNDDDDASSNNNDNNNTHLLHRMILVMGKMTGKFRKTV